jgi:hypothetical protein
MAPHAKLLLAEMILPARVIKGQQHQRVAITDLNMLVMLGGRERNEVEFRDLLKAAGFDLCKAVPICSNSNILEAVRA